MKTFTLFLLIMLNCSNKKESSQSSSFILLSKVQESSGSTKAIFQNDTSFNMKVTAIKTIQVNWKNWNSSLKSKPHSINLLYQADSSKNFEILSTFKNNARNETKVSVSSYLISKSSKFKLQSAENQKLQTGVRVLTEEKLKQISGNMTEKSLKVEGLDSVALSSDGSVIAIGDKFYGSDSKGAVHIYEKNADGTWKNPTLLQPTALSKNDFLGSDIDLSDDGTVLAVSTTHDNTGAKSVNGNRSISGVRWSGAVYIYEKKSDGTWGKPTYIKAFNPGERDGFGKTISLSGDGNTLAVGANLEDGNLGNTNTICPRCSLSSIKAIEKIVNGATISKDNNNFDNSGAVYIYEKETSGNWTSSTYIKAKMFNSGGQLGVSVSLDKDGDTLAVGSQRSGVDVSEDFSSGTLPNSGVVYVFQKESGDWKQKQLLEASNRYGYSLFGYSVSLSDDGNSLLIGSPSEDGKQTGVSIDKPKAKTGWSSSEKYKSGAAYLFQLENKIWEQKLYIKANNTGKDDRFGRSIAMSGDAKTIIVGAPYEDSNGKPSDNSKEKSGAVYIYKIQKNQWKFWKYLKPTQIKASDEFGKSIALSKDASSLIILSGYKSAFLY